MAKEPAPLKAEERRWEEEEKVTKQTAKIQDYENHVIVPICKLL